MNHEQIDQLNLVDQYLMGKLPDGERDRFEEHFVACPRCTEQLQMAGNFLRDFRLLAAEQAAQGEAPRPAGALSKVSKIFQRKTLAWAVAALLVVAIFSTAWLIRDSRRLREEVNQARALSEQWQRRYEEERRSASDADQRRREAEAQQAEPSRAPEANPTQQQARRGAAAEPPARQLPAQGALPVFVLPSVRGQEGSGAEPGAQLILRSSQAIFALSIPLEEETQSQTYRITILDERKRRISTSGGLKPGAQDVLSIYLRSDLFRPGRYMLLVESDNKEGGRRLIGQSPFQIVKKP